MEGRRRRERFLERLSIAIPPPLYLLRGLCEEGSGLGRIGVPSVA
jgi:hypothetical protein